VIAWSESAGAAVVTLCLLAVPAVAAAQERLPVRVEGGGGYSVFADDGAIDHTMFGGNLRWVSSRLAVGPEIVYMIGPERDRDLFLTGVISFDVLRRRRVTPFVTAAAGFMGHSDATNSWSEFAFVLGGGARILLADRLYIAPEYRFGRPLHARIGVNVGYEF
jgi:opacity protein-like surface antigen